MDMLQLGHWMGRTDTRIEQMERDIRDLKRERRRRPRMDITPSALLPYLYGVGLIIGALLGKIDWSEVGHLLQR